MANKELNEKNAGEVTTIKNEVVNMEENADNNAVLPTRRGGGRPRKGEASSLIPESPWKKDLDYLKLTLKQDIKNNLSYSMKALNEFKSSVDEAFSKENQYLNEFTKNIVEKVGKLSSVPAELGPGKNKEYKILSGTKDFLENQMNLLDKDGWQFTGNLSLEYPGRDPHGSFISSKSIYSVILTRDRISD